MQSGRGSDGAHAEQLEKELRGLNLREANNPEWESGMDSSIRAGIQAVVKANDKITGAHLDVVRPAFRHKRCS